MLKKIIAIRNVGRFLNSAGTGDTQLSKHTFIVGANGYGKTTICQVLRSLNSGEAAHILGRKTLGAAQPPTADLLVGATVHRFDGTAWSAAFPSIAIFDGVFVAENIHSGDAVELDHKRNLYRVIIGDDGVRLAKEDAAIAAEGKAKSGEITATTKAIQPHVPRGMSLDAFIALPPDAGIDAAIAEQENAVTAAREAGAIKARALISEIPELEFPADFANLLSRTIEDIAADSERRLSEHLAGHGMTDGGGNWISTGVEHAGRETCPFCGQNIRGLPLISAFRAVFSEQYKALKFDIDEMRRRVGGILGETALARLDTLAEQNKGSIEFWVRYCRFNPDELALRADVGATACDLCGSAIALLDQKARAPLEAVAIDDRFTVALRDFAVSRNGVTAVNVAIRDVNELVAAKKAETENADVKVAEEALVRLKAVKLRHSPDVSALCDEHVRLTAEKALIDGRKEEVRRKLDAHTQAVVKPYETRINDYLLAFNAGFSITETKHGYPGGVATSSYQIVINEVAVEVGDGRTPIDQPSFKNTLSAGDRTTLAMAVFLAHLERDASLERKIVVFDDPFSSQDAFRRRQTVQEIIKVAKKCVQIIVVSHDATFLKQLWDKAAVAERASLVIADHRSKGSKIMPFDLERACQGRTASDIDDLQTFLTLGAGALIDLIRKMRAVLETHCRTTYPASFLPEDWLGEIVRKIREGGADHPAHALYDELDSINDYTAQYHHGENLGDVTPDQIDPAEMTGFTRKTLKIVNALQA